MKETKGNEYPVYKLVYTDMQGKRSIAYIAEESSEIAIGLLKEVLESYGYSKKNLENLFEVSRKTECSAYKGSIVLRSF